MEKSLNDYLKEEIHKNKDENYRLFSMKLTPGRDDIVGVRISVLRNIAKEIAKKDPISFLENAKSDYYEEKIVEGLVIGYMKTDLETVFYYTEKFIPKIDSWGICDTFCSNLKIAKGKKYQKDFWYFINKYKDSENEFETRFAAVMMMTYFINDEYIEKVLKTLNEIDTEKFSGYYLKMGIAWALSMCFVKYPEKTLHYLKNTSLDNDTFNKTIQKILESNQVDRKTKKHIKTLKK